ncbi:putative dienelactone hydrolase [Rhodococcus sp. LBL1]|nr:putative dienelactone hydrolase [Rhodococcus sp. LBL1]MDH6682240.1 putative dienelactone hydrolase [Rhodococcus sp. LBL2]
MHGRRIGAVCAMTFALVASTAAITAPASAEPGVRNPTIVLPAPSGPSDVGSTTLHLVDSQRADPWQPDQRRELMVTVTYPAADAANYPLAHYVSTEFAAGATRDLAAALSLPIDVQNLLGLHSNAHSGAPVQSTADRSLPVVLFSPGAVVPRIFGTGEAEDLASRGYVVVSIDHTFDSQAVEFPGGRVVEGIAPPEESAQSTPWLRTALDARVADTEFVLDEIIALADGHNPDVEQRALPNGLSQAIDPSRIGMFGHSLGGFTTAEAMARDPRIDAGVNLDGSLCFDDDLGLAATRGLDRPMLLMSSQQVSDTGAFAPSWNTFRDNTRGWTRELELAQAGHHSFTDLQSLIPPSVAAAAPEATGFYIGTIPPENAIPAVREYVAAAFDRFLRNRTADLLDGPDGRFPDVRYVR